MPTLCPRRAALEPVGPGRRGCRELGTSAGSHAGAVLQAFAVAAGPVSAGACGGSPAGCLVDIVHMALDHLAVIQVLKAGSAVAAVRVAGVAVEVAIRA